MKSEGGLETATPKPTVSSDWMTEVIAAVPHSGSVTCYSRDERDRTLF